MTVGRRHLIAIVALATVFCCGWATGRKTGTHALARAAVALPASLGAGAAADPGPSCTDRIAMEANANLVGQVHDYRARLTTAEQDRATNDEQRVAFALTGATVTLFDEMVRALGREKALRAVDNGVLCLEETFFDLHENENDDG